MDVFFIFVAVFLVGFGNSYAKQCNSSFTNQITVSKDGNNTKECLSNKTACQTLGYVLGNIVNNYSFTYLRNSTRIVIQNDQALQENYYLKNLKDFALCGQEYEAKYPVYIKCAFRNGLIVESSLNIVLEHLTFFQCGSAQLSKDYLKTNFYTGVYMSDVINVTITSCNIAKSLGIGMTLFDVGGHVTFRNTNFLENIGSFNNSEETFPKILNVGGGLAIEFTYNCETEIFNSSNNHYSFFECNFINNDATFNHGKFHLDPRKMVGNNSVIFGCGGGLGMFFKGQAIHNNVELQCCQFYNNSANWGGGYAFIFQDESQDNYIQLNHVTVKNNSALFAGGGGRFDLFPQVRFEKVFSTYPNYFHHIGCTFQGNYASWGGGVSVFGTTVILENIKKNNNLLFVQCKWLENQAVVGSAIGLLSDWTDPIYNITKNKGKGLAYTIKLVDCILNNNIILYGLTHFGTNIVGTGAVYTNIAPIVMQNVSLCSNSGTALVLDWSFVEINKQVLFCGNYGSKGGAIALYGRSKIKLVENSVLVFKSNQASLQGGAIYVQTQGPNLKAFNVRLLDRSTCFFSYSNPKEDDPNTWETSVVFQNNTAPNKSGNSIYANTLQYCRNYGNFTEILEWNNTFFFQNKSKINPEIMTDPATITSCKDSWKGFPGQNLYPNIELKDEKNQSTNGLLKISIKPHPNSDLHLSSDSSHYIYISDGNTMSPVKFHSSKMHDVYSVTLASVYTQIITTTVENISTLQLCYGGYSLDSKQQKCVCLEKGEQPFGYSHCSGDGETIFLKAGFWGYIDEHGQLGVTRCPSGYCECASKSDNENNCVFVRFGVATQQCSKHREGRLCGSCETNYSILVGKEECHPCTNKGVLWLLLLAAGLTVAVIGVIYFELDFFSGYLNSWLYVYHIILLFPPSDAKLDPFITFVISLTHGTFDIGRGECFWNGMDELQKKTLAYFMPFYCLFLLFVTDKLLRYFPNLPFSHHSLHRAFVTIMIICYASLLQNTMTILQPIPINGKYYVYVQADETYLGTYHSYFAVPALFVLVFMVIPFPFVIAFNGFFRRHFRFLRRFTPLFQVLQSPYRNNRSWFASYYIFCRVIFIFTKMASPVYPHSNFAIWEFISVVILMVFVLLEPYSDENRFFFMVDTVFLSLLCLINSLTNAVQVNDGSVSVTYYHVAIHVLTYVPLVYSVGLLVRHIIHAYRRRYFNNLDDQGRFIQQ